MFGSTITKINFADKIKGLNNNDTDGMIDYIVSAIGLNEPQKVRDLKRDLKEKIKAKLLTQDHLNKITGSLIELYEEDDKIKFYVEEKQKEFTKGHPRQGEQKNFIDLLKEMQYQFFFAQVLALIQVIAKPDTNCDGQIKIFVDLINTKIKTVNKINLFKLNNKPENLINQIDKVGKVAELIVKASELEKEIAKQKKKVKEAEKSVSEASSKLEKSMSELEKSKSKVEASKSKEKTIVGDEEKVAEEEEKVAEAEEKVAEEKVAKDMKEVAAAKKILDEAKEEETKSTGILASTIDTFKAGLAAVTGTMGAGVTMVGDLGTATMDTISKGAHTIFESGKDATHKITEFVGSTLNSMAEGAKGVMALSALGSIGTMTRLEIKEKIKEALPVIKGIVKLTTLGAASNTIESIEKLVDIVTDPAKFIDDSVKNINDLFKPIEDDSETIKAAKELAKLSGIDNLIQKGIDAAKALLSDKPAENKYFKMSGGSYQQKYMKYKAKYLKLKQSLRY